MCSDFSSVNGTNRFIGRLVFAMGIPSTLAARHPGQSIRVLMFASRAMDNRKGILLQPFQPTSQLPFRFPEFGNPSQRSMVCPEGEAPTQQIWPEVLYERDHSQKLPPCDAVAAFWFCEDSAGVNNHSLSVPSSCI